MKERPILFSAPMVRALLAGTKTQTRRIVNPLHDWHVDEVPDRQNRWRNWPIFEAYVYAEPETIEVPCPYGMPGDRLWVRETHSRIEDQSGRVASYRASGDEPISGKWTPSIHMKRWASRIDLQVTGVRVERLQEISGEDARGEGVSVPRCDCEPCARSAAMCPADASAYILEFAALWKSINGPDSWAKNLWVWVVEFKRHI